MTVGTAGEPRESLFSLLSDADRSSLERMCPVRRLRRGAVVFRAGDRATDLYVVHTGKVKVSAPSADGGERILFVLGPGDIFGEAFLARFERYATDAVALTDTTVSPVCLDKLLEVTTTAPGIALALARLLARRIVNLEAQLEVTTAPVSTRVAGALMAFARRFGLGDATGGRKTHLRLDLTHEELASFIGSTRVTVTNALGELRDLGLVEGTRGEYEVDLAALERYLEAQQA